jgi:hypothetical protein
MRCRRGLPLLVAAAAIPALAGDDLVARKLVDLAEHHVRRKTVRCEKAVDRQFLAGASWQGQMIKCADMLSNTKDIVAHDLGFARAYVPEKQLRIDELTKARKVSYPIWRAAYLSIVQAEQVVHAAA